MTTTHKFGWCFIFLFFALPSCFLGQKKYNTKKIDGVSFVAPARKTTVKHMAHVQSVNANWVCLMPYAFTPLNDTKVVYNSPNQWWGERDEGVSETIGHARELNLKIMLKPHLWLRHGAFTGDLSFPDTTQWKAWEENYTKYILDYAELAEAKNIELFCIGTELKSFVANRPQCWQKIIRQVKSVYSGKLVYAGNWDSYIDFPFWDQLDYIGIDAYFPLSEEETPTTVQLDKAWAKWKGQIKNYSEKHKKQILFTEYGYRNISNCALRPWESHRENVIINQDCQCNTLKAFYTNFWDEDWIAGGFLWKWFDQHETINSNGKSTSFSVQQKPAQAVVKKYYQGSDQ